VRLDVPIGEDEQRIVSRIPGLTVALCQCIGQGISHRQAGELAQKVLQGEVLVGEAIQHFQSIPLVVVQVAGTGQPQDRQIEQVI